MAQNEADYFKMRIRGCGFELPLGPEAQHHQAAQKFHNLMKFSESHQWPADPRARAIQFHVLCTFADRTGGSDIGPLVSAVCDPLVVAAIHRPEADEVEAEEIVEWIHHCSRRPPTFLAHIQNTIEREQRYLENKARPREYEVFEERKRNRLEALRRLCERTFAEQTSLDERPNTSSE